MGECTVVRGQRGGEGGGEGGFLFAGFLLLDAG